MTATVKLYKGIYSSEQKVWFSSGPFNNNYNNRFVLNGVLYETINDFMLEKASELRDPPAYGTTAIDYSKGFKDSDIFWDLRLYDIYKYAVFEKVMQNIETKRLLVETSDRRIAYADLHEESMYMALRRPTPIPEAPYGTFSATYCLGPVLMDVRVKVKEEITKNYPTIEEQLADREERLERKRLKREKEAAELAELVAAVEAQMAAEQATSAATEPATEPVTDPNPATEPVTDPNPATEPVTDPNPATEQCTN
jgi:predicted NAD-dependent protein-ADP-ribosyltransferase YbiA (DUF1768 family)